jgi:mannose-6-phosphate isomerase-like protein (cupin superfamily)
MENRLYSDLDLLNQNYSDNGMHIRPWGGFLVLDSNREFKVKKIFVNPGKRLSLQKHEHRSEHWTVVIGTARVRIGDVESIISVNESVYIEKGQLHRLENIGSDVLYVIETQCGDYFGEDDIIRIEDDFERVDAKKAKKIIQV